MQANVGLIDMLIRIVAALALLAVSIVFHELEFFSLSAALVAIVLFVTALTRTCPVYRALGMRPAVEDSIRMRGNRGKRDDEAVRDARPGAVVGLRSESTDGTR
jgi:hypothetical protein